jgi:GT2 family glycosyltransferase
MMKIAVLLTCFNRREKSLTCLGSLLSIVPDCDIYLVDDGSTDNTAEAIKAQFPQVKVIAGDGNLFWNRGMCLAWKEAAKKDYDYYLWLNDDVVLYDGFLQELLECQSEADHKAVISGIIESQDKQEVLYGGTDMNRRLIQPNGKMQQITNLNGNVVLVPRSVYQQLGTLDPFFHHDLGDVDYGFRAAAKGIPVLSTRAAVAYGEKNHICRERLNNTTMERRFKRLYSPLGSNPNINFYFRKKHKSVFNAVGYYVFQHLLNVVPDKVNSTIFGTKYQ